VAVKKNLAVLQDLSSGCSCILTKLFSWEDVERAEERLRHESDVLIFDPPRASGFERNLRAYETEKVRLRRIIFGRKPEDLFADPFYLVWLKDGLDRLIALMMRPPEYGSMGQPIVDGYWVEVASYFRAVILPIVRDAEKTCGV
jgi:hypothetical protein